jgi:hypothetical protein
MKNSIKKQITLKNWTIIIWDYYSTDWVATILTKWDATWFNFIKWAWDDVFIKIKNDDIKNIIPTKQKFEIIA